MRTMRQVGMKQNTDATWVKWKYRVTWAVSWSFEPLGGIGYNAGQKRLSTV